MKSIYKMTKVYGLVLLVLFMLMGLCAQIPRQSIQKNVKESADYMMNSPLFASSIKGVDALRQDHYADSITLNILYHLEGGKHTISSLLLCSYYTTDQYNENRNLQIAVNQPEVKANQEYYRYWHGGMIFVRPLLMFFNIQQIYVLLSVLLGVLTIWISVLLKRKIGMFFMISYLAGCVLCTNFIVPFTLEYVWMYVLMKIGAIILLSIKEITKEKVSILFLILGILTCFFDFLTTEVLVLLIPLEIYIVLKIKDGSLTNGKEAVRLCTRCIVIWAIGFISMWILKWVLTGVILQVDIFQSVIPHAYERSSYKKMGVLSIIVRNLACIFPFTLGSKPLLYLFLASILFLLSFYLYRKPIHQLWISGIMLGLAFVPILRYLVLAGHSYDHYFFTYRSLQASIFALLIGWYYGIDRKSLERGKET